jgi:hypothetical protein
MRYSKPTLILLPAAIDTIKGTMKRSNVIQDSPTYLTASAYEADE